MFTMLLSELTKFRHAGGASRFGSGLFLLIQVVILLDFTHNWNAAWVAKDEQFW